MQEMQPAAVTREDIIRFPELGSNVCKADAEELAGQGMLTTAQDLDCTSCSRL
jgi:hypothetical protein